MPGLADGVGAWRQQRGLETRVGAAQHWETPFPDSEIHIFSPLVFQDSGHMVYI